MHTNEWRVDIHIDQQYRHTRARAWLHNADDSTLVGVGTAHPKTGEADVPEIGDELAVARALVHLAEQLMNTCRADIEAITHGPARLGD
ncbi:DUF1876 domain-containing protein [Gandjariella thermophila]|nr:DUF1876 domain-containing protein [Gandjariella thermophila]